MQNESNSIVSIRNLSKSYSNGFTALKNINLEIKKGEIIALLGPNGAGKTTLISIICGIVNPSEGSVSVGGYDIIKDYRQTRSMIGLVPQELAVHAFESVMATTNFSRGLFGKPTNTKYVEEILGSLSLLDKKNSTVLTLSGGMKRRVMIAKALSHEPNVLFLDEPTAGVDVELRKDMWNVVRALRDRGVTIILTTHYIEEAEEIADRVGIMNKGELILVEEKSELMHKLGKKQILLDLARPLQKIPDSLQSYELDIKSEGNQLLYTYDGQDKESGIAAFLENLKKSGIEFRDLNTIQSSLEEIFVQLVKESK
ncbi:ABC transporter ATP-binding protein [Leptospira semungkisensis]|uniref:ABC transporter ATP-binding protein n=1 Tax=Leptospira semungkisensis TaxID=2484985 RepID=A0A4R9FRB9_9LEPT|nr:ABC transporter ATP-binding protein [Leptospira semungkisensis]TGK01083.1 ABC transporter ATP-binding protein [Leptospira semungkisensis]